MNVMSCGGNCRRLTLVLSLAALGYLLFLHRDDYYTQLQFDQRSCKVPDKLVFLKTHKTASSTIQNILMRWGTKHNKTFALPSTGKTIFRYWKPWSVGEYHKMETHPDMIVHHMRFSREVMKVFGQNSDTIYISILRDPVTMFESLFNYMKAVAPQFSQAGTLEKFLENPKKYQKVGTSKTMTSFFSRNHMTFEFGADPNTDDRAGIRAIIDRIAANFDFILINEYMAESLILLRHRLCMSLSDIACFVTNSRKNTKILSPKLTRQIEEWNKADVMLYRHFNRTLWEEIDQLGVDVVNQEKQQLEELINSLTDKCVEGYVDNSQLDPEFQVYKQPGVKVLGIKLTPEGMDDTLCRDMARPEFPWTELLMQRQGQSTATLHSASRT